MSDLAGKIFDFELFKKLKAFISPYKLTYRFVVFAAIAVVPVPIKGSRTISFSSVDIKINRSNKGIGN